MHWNMNLWKFRGYIHLLHYMHYFVISRFVTARFDFTQETRNTVYGFSVTSYSAFFPTYPLKLPKKSPCKRQATSKALGRLTLMKEILTLKMTIWRVIQHAGWDLAHRMHSYNSSAGNRVKWRQLHCGPFAFFCARFGSAECTAACVPQHLGTACVP